MKTTLASLFILGALSTSTAFGGCGRESRVNFPVLPSGRSLAPQIGPSTPEADSPAALILPGNPTGLWLTTVTSAGQTVYQAFEAFTADGLEILNDNGPTLEGNVCLGTWSGAGRNVKVYHPAWSYDSAGNLIGSVVIRETITLDVPGMAFKGSVTVEAFDLNGHSQGIVFQGDLSGKRITG